MAKKAEKEKPERGFEHIEHITNSRKRNHERNESRISELLKEQPKEKDQHGQRKHPGVKKLFVGASDLNRTSMSIYSHGSGRQSNISYQSLNQRKKLSKSIVHHTYNDNGRRKSNLIKNQKEDKENVFRNSNLIKKNDRTSELTKTKNDENSKNKLQNKK